MKHRLPLRQVLVPWLYALLIYAAMTLAVGFAMIVLSMQSTMFVTLCPAHGSPQLEALVNDLQERHAGFSVELRPVVAEWCQDEAWTLELEQSGTLLGNISRQNDVADLISEHGIPSSAARYAQQVDETAAPLAGMVLLVLLAVMFLRHQRRTGTYVRAPELLYPTGVNLAIGFCIGAAAYLVLNVFGQLLYQFDRLPEQLLWDPNAAELSFEAIAVMVILAPIFEEVVFRAWLLEAWRKVMPPALALFLTAVLFSLAHPSGLMVNTLLLLPGLALGLIWLKTRSLSACITAHATWNGLVLLLTQIFGD